MTADDGIFAVPGLGTVPSVLQILQTDGTVDNTAGRSQSEVGLGPVRSKSKVRLDWTRPGPGQPGLVLPRTGGIIGRYIDLQLST